ncbi:MAG TPA: MmcQ/YjbR family DNA-binding protein [Candidatus Eisenbacteria bacterium]
MAISKSPTKRKAAAPASKASNRSSSRHADALAEFCRNLPGATEDVKWGKDLIFSVGGKMFAGFQLPEGEPLGFKVDPPTFDDWVKRPGVIPAPYMARHSWISVTDRTKVAESTLKKLLKESHRLTAEKLSGKMREKLGLSGDS